MSILLCVKCACRAKFCSYLTNKLYCRKIKSKLNRDRKIKKSGGTPTPETKTCAGVLINRLCNFEGVTKPPTARLWSGLLTFTHSRDTYSRTVLIRSALINGMCIFEDGTRAATAASKSSVGLTSHTSPFCNDYNPSQSFAFWSLCSFSHTPKTALSSFLLSHKFACF